VFIADLVTALSRAGIDYCIVGGVAVNLHGVPRRTYNVDLVVPPKRKTLAALAQLLHALGLECQDPVPLEDLGDLRRRRRLLAERNLFSMVFVDPQDALREVDVVVSPPVDAVRLVQRAVTMKLGGVAVRCARLSDLMVMKRVSGHLQDADDVARLEQLKRRGRGGH
jgi:hypothetical protein